MGTDAAEFILEYLYDSQKNSLYHRYCDGEVKVDGSLADYSYFIKALIDLYETSFETRYLNYAIEINKSAIEKFYDKENSGFFDDDINSKDLFLFTKDSYDGSEPSGNSIMTDNLYRLAHFTDNSELSDKANKSLEFFYDEVFNSPFNSPELVCAVYHYLKPQMHIILTGNRESQDYKELLNAIHRKYLPFKTLISANGDTEKIIPFLRNIIKDFEKTNVYICENFKCNLPADNLTELKKILK
jgi:uncharacterized protein YyaL (SSP411 family)